MPGKVAASGGITVTLESPEPVSRSQLLYRCAVPCLASRETSSVWSKEGSAMCQGKKMRGGCAFRVLGA
jgi:hypothetical protein